MAKSSPIIGVVGVCASGKTTISRLLKARGIDCHHIAQEHSYVPEMWKIITRPDYLVYLQVSYPSTIARKKLNWTLEEYQEQLRRTQNAREHADLVIDTDAHSIDEILILIIQGLTSVGIMTPELDENK